MSDTIDAGKSTRAQQNLQAEFESMQERIVVASATLINEIGTVDAETLQETVARAVALIRELREGQADENAATTVRCARCDRKFEAAPLCVGCMPISETCNHRVREPAARTEATEAPCRVDPAAVVEQASQLRGIVAESGPLEVELELPHQVVYHPNDGGPPRQRPHREINVRAVGSDWADPVKQYGPGGDFEWIRLPVRGVDGEARGEGETTPAQCARCGYDITGPSVCDGCFRANNDAAQAALDNTREQLQRERADVQPTLAALSRALAEKQAECDEWRRRGADALERWAAEACESLDGARAGLRAGDELRERLMGDSPLQPDRPDKRARQLLVFVRNELDEATGHSVDKKLAPSVSMLCYALADLYKWAVLTNDRLTELESPDTRPLPLDAGPGLDVKVDDGGQAVPVCPVCGKLTMDAGGGHRCECFDAGGIMADSPSMTEDRWWKYVASLTGCCACHVLPALIDGLVHHSCRETGQRWRKEPREWYARHGGAGEQATDEADPAACPVCDDCSRRAECTPSEDGPDCERWCAWQATDEAP